jgi:hypothetical protein
MSVILVASTFSLYSDYLVLLGVHGQRASTNMESLQVLTHLTATRLAPDTRVLMDMSFKTSRRGAAGDGGARVQL